MNKIIAGILAIGAFAAVLAAGLARGLGLWDTMWRAALAGGLGFGLGIVVARIGLDLAKESVAPPEEPKPPAAPPKQ